MKPPKRLSSNNYGVLRSRKRRHLLQQRGRSGVYFKGCDAKHEQIVWQILEVNG